MPKSAQRYDTCQTLKVATNSHWVAFENSSLLLSLCRYQLSACVGLTGLLPSPAATSLAYVQRKDGSRHGSDFPTQLTLWKLFARLTEANNWDRETNLHREGFALVGDSFNNHTPRFH